MKRFLFVAGLLASVAAGGQTVIPNAGFENWSVFSTYTDPVDWDTPNFELNLIPFINISVVTKGPDRSGAGFYSARLETRLYPFPLAPMDVPGFMTCGDLTVDFDSGTYVLSGGVPVVDKPTHLKGYYKYLPKGGDSCVIGIGMTRTTGSFKDTVGLGYFSTKDSVPDWTPFSAWIDYTGAELPDSMNIIAMSTAQEVMTVGTVLYVDDLYLDYTVGTGKEGDREEIRVYNDRETERLMIFLDPESRQDYCIRLLSMRGSVVAGPVTGAGMEDRCVIPYQGLPDGVYLLEVIGHGDRLARKIFIH